jgi:hypothetical protein
MKNAIRYGAVALISVGVTLAAVHKPAPSLPTTCAEAYRQLEVSGVICDYSCSREEAERAITIRDLRQELCQKEADQQKARDEALTRDADKEWDRLHPEWQKAADDALNEKDHAGLDRALGLLRQREDFEKQWIKEHTK